MSWHGYLKPFGLRDSTSTPEQPSAPDVVQQQARPEQDGPHDGLPAAGRPSDAQGPFLVTSAWKGF